MGPICLEEREKKKRLISKLQRDRQVRLGLLGRVKNRPNVKVAKRWILNGGRVSCLPGKLKEIKLNLK